MRKILACVLAVSLVLCVSGISIMAETDYTGLNEECLTTEVKTAISKDLTMIDNWNNTPITWESSNPAVITTAGIVTRGDADQTVTLTAKEDGEAVKELTYTVLGKSKKVWYSENFNRPECVGKEVGALGLHDLSFVEESEASSGKAGFYRTYATAFNEASRLSIEKSPLDSNDYELCGKSLEKTLNFVYELPKADLPSEKITISADLTSTELNQFPSSTAYRKHEYIKFYSDKGNLIGQIHWLAAGAGNIRNGSINAVTGMKSVNNGDALTSSLKIVIDFTKREFEIIGTSNGTLNNNNKISIPTDETSLNSIVFAARTATSGFAHPDFWIDNLVIISE